MPSRRKEEGVLGANRKDKAHQLKFSRQSSTMAGYPVKGKTMRSDTHLPYIPHEIIHSGILLRLPAKSLARFRCVSKLWNATIGDPKFVKSHALRKSLRILALYRYRSNYRKSCTYDFITQDDRHFYSNTAMKTIQIVGHCNGLYCFRNNLLNLIILCNPCTRECLDHPLPPPPPPDHPFISYGFGFDPSRNEYKAVEIVLANFSLYRCMVYTFGAKNNSWRDITVQVNLSRHFKRYDTWGAVSACRALYINATLFWFFSNPWLFMAFDLRSEEFSFFEGPITRSDLCAGTSFLIDWEGYMCLGIQNLSAKNVHLYVYNSCRQDADRWHFKQVEVPSSYNIWKHGALGADSIFYALRGDELLLYTEGLDRCFYNLAGSELATKFPRALGVSGLLECQFTYHVENFLSLKTMQRSPPTRFHCAGVKMSVPVN